MQKWQNMILFQLRQVLMQYADEAGGGGSMFACSNKISVPKMSFW